MGRVSVPLICAILLVAVALVAQIVPSPGPIDREMVSSIRDHCQLPAPCRMTLGHLIPGDWDTFAEEAPRPMIVTRQGERETQDPANALYFRRRVFLFKGTQVIRQELEQTGVEHRLDGEIVFSALASGSSSRVSLDPQTVFRIEAVETPGDPKTLLSFSGAYYRLTQE